MTPAEVRRLLSQPWKHGEAVDLRGLHLEEMLNLSGLALCGVDFSDANFVQGVRATGARFDGLCWFQGARFGGPADFAQGRFASDARFDGAVFDAPATFQGAEFRGIAGFRGAHFSKGVALDAVTAYGNADFGAVRVESGASLAGAEFLGGLWADGSQLPADTDLARTEVHGRLWIRRARRGNAPLRTEDFGLAFGYTYS